MFKTIAIIVGALVVLTVAAVVFGVKVLASIARVVTDR